MVLLLTAAFVVLCSVIGVATAMYVIWQESRDEVAEPATVPLRSVGKSSVRMDIPQKYPLLRTRHSRTLR